MSASLVGSEMCIRDRQMSETVALQGAQSVIRNPLKASQCRNSPQAALSCLLYTSDAADDM
eukprot:448706-Alexandrium_andersonii.AAC.1